MTYYICLSPTGPGVAFTDKARAESFKQSRLNAEHCEVVECVPANEVEKLEAACAAMREAVEWCGCHEHSESPCDESGSHYRNLCVFCVKVDTALSTDAGKSLLDRLHKAEAQLHATELCLKRVCGEVGDPGVENFIREAMAHHTGELPLCDCASASPTYPDFRSTPHKENCGVRRLYESLKSKCHKAEAEAKKWKERFEYDAKFYDKADEHLEKLRVELDAMKAERDRLAVSHAELEAKIANLQRELICVRNACTMLKPAVQSTRITPERAKELRGLADKIEGMTRDPIEELRIDQQAARELRHMADALEEKE